jgi:hypothetical protein
MGTKKRGKPIPDGVLDLPQVGTPVLYDCKAAHNGYEMTYRDLTGLSIICAILLMEVGASSRDCATIPCHQLQINGGTRDASFEGRQRALNQKIPGAKLTWLPHPTLCASV